MHTLCSGLPNLLPDLLRSSSEGGDRALTKRIRRSGKTRCTCFARKRQHESYDLYITRHCVSVFWLCLIAFMFILAIDGLPKPIGIRRATVAIGGPLLLIAAGQSVIEIGQLSRRRFRDGNASSGGLLALLTALASGGLVMLGLFIIMIDRNLGRYHQVGLFRVDLGGILRLTFVSGILLIFATAGRTVVSGGQLSRQRFKEGRRSLGVLLALLTVLASGGMVAIGWATANFLLFVLLYRQ